MLPMGHFSRFSVVRVAIALLVIATANVSLAGQRPTTDFHNLNEAQWAEAFAAARAQTPDFRVESLEAFQQIALFYEQQASEGTLRNEFDLPAGDHIRCIDVETQLAVVNFEGSVPPPARTRPAGLAADPNEAERAAALAKVFGMDGSLDSEGRVRACPEGTVAKRVPFFDELLRFRNLRDYLHKDPRGDSTTGGTTVTPQADAFPAAAVHEYGHAYRSVANLGARALFNVWRPFVEQPSEFSLSQMWIVNGSGAGLQTVEAGWQVYPARLSDSLPRVFVFSTSDDYNPNGPSCYEPCGRFWYTSANAPIGASLAPISTLGGTQYEFSFEWYRDVNHDWWLNLGGTWIGYYPHTLYNSAGLLNQGAAIDFGGEIVNIAQQGVHTTTRMGSGNFAGSGFGYSSFIRQITYTDTGYTVRDATSLTPDAPTPSYYNVAINSTHDSFWGNSSLFFGGPGRAFSNTVLQSASATPSNVSAGSTFSIQYTVNASSPDYVMLGASIRPSGGSTTISDPSHDSKISLATGTSFTSRNFLIPAGTASGSYDLIVALWRDLNTNSVIDAEDLVLATTTYNGAIVIPSPVTAPTVTTNAATNITDSAVTFNGTVNPNGGGTDTAFLFGTTSSYGAFITSKSISGTSPQAISSTYSSLSCGTTYHYAAYASNSAGTRTGNDVSFATSACPCSYHVLSPNGGENFQRGQSTNVTWQSSNCSSATRIDLYRSNAYQSTLVTGTSNSGSFFWVIPSATTPASDYSIRISDSANNAAADFSDGFFTISAACSVGTPAITAAASVTAGSAGNSASATATGAVSYQWSISNGTLTSSATAQSVFFTAGSSGAVVLTVSAFDSAGCSAQAQKSITITAPSARLARGDFDGNGISDIFWRNSSTGDHSIWYVDGTGFHGGPTGPPPLGPAYTLAATGDFNHDGKGDFLWRNASTGELFVWYMNGGTLLGTLNLPPVQSSVSVAGAGDFNGDGYADIFWRNEQTGANSIWYLTAGGWTGGGATLATISLNLKVVAVADMNGDGFADVVWRNMTDGTVDTWLMNGGAITGGGHFTGVPLSVTLMGTGDFNGDGKFDLLWRNLSSGATSVWFTSGSTITGGIDFGSIPGPVAIAGVGDFNGDGRSDLLWRNESTAANSIWFVNGTATISGVQLPPISGSALKIVSPRP